MRLVATLLVAVPLVAACGEVPPAVIDAPGADVDAAVGGCAASSLTVDEFFVCVSRAACALIDDCFGSTTTHLDCDHLPINLFDGLTTTAARRLLDDSVARGRAQWNPTAAATCVARITGGCELMKSNADLLAECGAIVGNVNDGAACQADFECATAGARCEAPAGGEACGAMVCRKPAATGQSCANGGFCGPADYCVFERDTASGADVSVCDSGAAGRPCDGGSDCDPGLFCNGGHDDSTAAGTCTTSKPAGSICSDDRECLGELLCVGETATTTGVCRDVRAQGATCDGIFGCFGHQYCDGPSGGPGTCRPALGVGQPCGIALGRPWCGATLACDGGSCQPAGAVGATCTRGSDGVFASDPNACSTGLHCSNEITMATTGTCAAPLGDGAACGSDDHCTSGYCGPTTRVCGPVPVCSF